MSNVKYTTNHEWISIEGNIATVGVTDFALEQLGDLVFVEVPDAGRTVSQGDDCAVVESVKAASEVYAPLSGEITEGNSAVADDPGAVSGDPAGDGWFFKIKFSDEGELGDTMDADAYKEFVASLD